MATCLCTCGAVVVSVLHRHRDPQLDTLRIRTLESLYFCCALPPSPIYFHPVYFHSLWLLSPSRFPTPTSSRYVILTYKPAHSLSLSPLGLDDLSLSVSRTGTRIYTHLLVPFASSITRELSSHRTTTFAELQIRIHYRKVTLPQPRFSPGYFSRSLSFPVPFSLSPSLAFPSVLSSL